MENTRDFGAEFLEVAGPAAAGCAMPNFFIFYSDYKSPIEHFNATTEVAGAILTRGSL